MSNDAKIITEDELVAQIEENKRKREADCSDEIKEILKKYNCALLPVTIVAGGEISSQVHIKAN